jgi:hypothetical protein
LQIGHTIHDGCQRLHAALLAVPQYDIHSSARGKLFVLNLDNLWYGRLKLLFTMYVKTDGKEEPFDMECAYVSFCYEIKLEPSGMY